jgi:hypothetical protein
MKFVAARPFADPDADARKLVEIANATEPVQDGRIHIELINAPANRRNRHPFTLPVPAEEGSLASRRASWRGWRASW